MFVFFGWSTKKIGTKQIDRACPACHSPSLSLVGMQRIFHIFWIPTLPLKKSTVAACASCAATYPLETVGISKQETYFKTPWWSFSGLGILMVLLALGFYADASKEKIYEDFKTNPQAGVYFTFKSKDPDYAQAPYCFGKIEAIKGDKILVRFGRYTYSKNREAARSVRISKDKVNEFFDTETVELTKDLFKEFDIRTLKH